jgi:hypothetical protein
MLARSTTLQHPVGRPLVTPLLVPSFSSKGFGVSPKGKPEVSRQLQIATQFITDSMLLSAYDIHHGHVKAPRRAIAEITFVDSGGYESTSFQDLSEFFVHSVQPKPWDEDRLCRTLDRWPDHIPAVFIGFDHRGEIPRQAKRAHHLLKRYPRQLHALLIKPKAKKERLLPISDMVANVADLARFHIIGVTEKELGDSLIDRMDNISRIRLALDDANLRGIPLHIFGSLDPITVPLYFMAGAEIFDGLTWLRYGYHGGAALYRWNSAVLRHGVHHTDEQIKLLTMQENLIGLSELTTQLKRLLNDPHDFEKLAPNGDTMRKAFDLLRTRNPRVTAIPRAG